MDAAERADKIPPELNTEPFPGGAPPLPPVDAEVRVTVSPDGLKAVLSVSPPENGGAAPGPDAFRAALSEGRVVFGLDEERLLELAGHPVYGRAAVVAKGLPPANGKDGSFELRIRTDRELRPREREDGTVDYHDLGIVENVRKGQVLCTIAHPTEGTPGRTVTGETIPPVRGRAVPSMTGRNTSLSPDGTSILSCVDGQVEYDGKKISVSETLYIQENVDNSTGDIKAAGNVVVKGTVLPGFTVEADGNVEIWGTVESACVKAGGNVSLKSGITGSTLSCGGDLTSRFIENSDIFVRGEVKSEYVMGSSVRCGRSLRVVGFIAKIVGGLCMAGQDIEAREIGSSSGVKTGLELGTDPSFIDRQRELERQIPELEKQRKSLKSLISLFEQYEKAGRLTPEKKEMLDNALFSYKTNEKLTDEKNRELSGIREAIEAKGFGRVVCTGTIYPGTRVSIGGESMRITDALSNTSVYFSEGAVRLGAAR